MKLKINKNERNVLSGLVFLAQESFKKAEEYRDGIKELLEITDTNSIEDDRVNDVMWDGMSADELIKQLNIKVDTSFTGNSLKKKK